MTKKLRPIKIVLVPIDPVSNGEHLLAIAKAIATEVILVGVVPIEAGQSVSAGVQTARAIRKRLLELDDETTRYKSTVIVSATPWQDLQEVIANEQPDLFIAEWKDGQITFGASSADLFSNPPCNVAIVRGASQIRFDKTLITVRGGPHAELALQIGMSIRPPQLDLLHIALTGAATDAPFKGIQHILRHLPEINLRAITTDDAVRTISEESQHYDAVILGASAGKATGVSQLGHVSDTLLRESPSTVIVAKSQRPMSETMLDESVGAKAISILVDKWFAENTFHADEFSDLKQLMALKEKQGSTISLALPALNEEETVGNVISTVKKALMDKVPLLDEIVLIDSSSTDRTRQIAEKLDIPVYIHQELLPELGARSGKGEALWKSLLVTKGDIIVWIDTDIINIHPRFVYGVIGPLLLNSDIQLVKGFYRRPLRVGDKVQAGGGGLLGSIAGAVLGNKGGVAVAGLTQLEGLGLSTAQIANIGSALKDFIAKNSGAGALSQIANAVPGLSHILG